MSNYSQITDFSAKDSLASGNPSKVILGADVDAELAAISTAIGTKIDNISTLSEDTAPSLTGDYAVTYDSSASTHKKVLLPRLLGPSATFAYATGSSSQNVTAATWTPLTCITSETIDTAGLMSSGTVAPTSALYDGYYLVFARVSATHGAGTIRLAVTRFNSGGTALSRKYVEWNPSGSAFQGMGWGVHYLTFASGDYIGLELWADTGLTAIPNSSQNELIAFKIA